MKLRVARKVVRWGGRMGRIGTFRVALDKVNKRYRRALGMQLDAARIELDELEHPESPG